MKQLIKAPAILPNNMRQIREMRGITISDLSSALNLNHSYISILETHKANMSGITALKIMKQLNANFIQFFDVRKKLTLPTTINTNESITITLAINSNYLDETEVINIINKEEAIVRELKRLDIEGEVVKHELISNDPINGQDIVDATFDVELLIQKTVKEEFNINFSAEVNIDLLKQLHDKKPTELQHVTLKPSDFTILNNKVHILNKSKILKIGVPVQENYTTIDINSVKFNNDKKGNVKTIELDLMCESSNNIKYIQEYLNLSDIEIQKSLDIGENSFKRLLNGKQRLSTKMMWKMCKLFRLPLELIINIPAYIDSFN